MIVHDEDGGDEFTPEEVEHVVAACERMQCFARVHQQVTDMAHMACTGFLCTPAEMNAGPEALTFEEEQVFVELKCGGFGNE